MPTHYLTKLRRSQVHGHHLRPMVPNSGRECTCLNCGTTFHGSYCPHCGQPSKVERLSIRQGFIDLFTIVTNFESGFFHTCLELCYRPGYMIRDFINGHRREYVKPLQLLFLLGTIMLVVHYLLFRTGYDQEEFIDFENIQDSGHEQLFGMIETVLHWLSNNLTIVYLLLVTLLVLPNRLCFHWVDRDKRLNVSEHFFAMVYVGCQLMLLNVIQLPYQFFVGETVIFSGLGLPSLLLAWDFSQLFSIHFRRSLRLTLTSIFLGFLLFLVVIVVGCIILLGITGEYHNFVNVVTS